MDLSFDKLFPGESAKSFGKKLIQERKTTSSSQLKQKFLPKADAGLPMPPDMSSLYEAMNNKLTGFQQHYDESTLTPAYDYPTGTRADRPLEPYIKDNYQTPEQTQGPINTSLALPQPQKKQSFHGGFNGPAIAEVALGALGAVSSVLPNKIKKYNPVQPKPTYNPYGQGTGSQAIMAAGGTVDPDKPWEGKKPASDNARLALTPKQQKAYNEKYKEELAKENIPINKKASAKKADIAKRAKTIQDNINQPSNYQGFGKSHLADKMRIFPEDPDSAIDTYFNPLTMLGEMSDRLGNAIDHDLDNPFNILPYQGHLGEAVAEPLALGALAGIGEPATEHFVNNILNPLAGIVGTDDEFKALTETVKNRFKKPNVPLPTAQETEMFEAIRNIGSIGAKPDAFRDPKILQSIYKRSQNIPDKTVQDLTGYTKEQIKERMEMMQQNGFKPTPAYRRPWNPSTPAEEELSSNIVNHLSHNYDNNYGPSLMPGQSGPANKTGSGYLRTPNMEGVEDSFRQHLEISETNRQEVEQLQQEWREYEEREAARTARAASRPPATGRELQVQGDLVHHLQQSLDYNHPFFQDYNGAIRGPLNKQEYYTPPNARSITQDDVSVELQSINDERMASMYDEPIMIDAASARRLTPIEDSDFDIDIPTRTREGYSYNNQMASPPESFTYQPDKPSIAEYIEKNKPERSIFSRLENKLNNNIQRTPLPKNNTELIHALFASSSNSPAKRIIEAVNQVKASPKGSNFIPAESLSNDSYRISANLTKRALDEGIVDVNFHGFNDTNTMSFLSKAGVDVDSRLKDINASIDMMNSKLKKKLPYAKMNRWGEIDYPNFTVTRKDAGGGIGGGGGTSPVAPMMGLLGDIASGVKDFFTPDPTPKPRVKKQLMADTQEMAPTPYDPMADANSSIRKMADAYDKRGLQYYDESLLNKNYSDRDIENKIQLKTGKFKGVKVPTRVIDDASAAAKRAGVDPYDLLGLMGQESTFGVAKGRNQTDKTQLLSGWNLDENYKPYDYLRYLADNKVKGAVATRTPHGFDYSQSDFAELNKQLAANPKLMEGYNQKLAKTPSAKQFDPYYEAAMRIKKKGLQSYNPGDPNYIKDVNNSVALVRQDPELQKYLSKRK